MKRILLVGTTLAMLAGGAHAATENILVTDGDENKWIDGTFTNDGKILFSLAFFRPSNSTILDFHIRLLGGIEFLSPDSLVSTGTLKVTEHKFDGSNFNSVMTAPNMSALTPDGKSFEYTQFVQATIDGTLGSTVNYQYQPTTSGTMTPAPVPLPAGFPLLTFALFLLGCFRARHSKVS